MTTNFNDVVVTGNADVTQLTVKANATQTKTLQSWQTSGGVDLAHLTSDGRLEIGNNLGVGAPLDAVVQVNQDITLPTSQPTSGWHSLGRLTGALSGAVNWVLHELQLLGTGGVSGLQTALRAYLTHSNSGTSTSAELRAMDAKTTNTTGSSGFAVGQATGIRATVSNAASAWLNNAVAVEAAITNDTSGNVTQATALSVVPPTNAGTISTLYGLLVPDLTQGGTNYAIYTGQGPVHFGDNQELKVLAATPAGNPPVNFIKMYPKLNAGAPNLYAKDSAGVEYNLSGSGGSLSAADTAALKLFRYFTLF